MSLESQVIGVLKTLIDPVSQQDIISGELVQGLHLTPSGVISFSLQINRENIQEWIDLKESAETLLHSLPGVTRVQIVLTAQRKPKVPLFSKSDIRGLKHILAIASGKGGVGKSTTAVNLACALHGMDLKVGILDGDIYGPSLPRLLGVNQKPISDDGKLINPLKAHGVECMSIGFLMAENNPAIWRGPMIQKAFYQMLRQTKWGELDVLIIDLPPGTGDVQLTLAQAVLLSGVIIVSTPQELALMDARKGLEMFTKLNIPILGLVENMSYFLCPHCNERSEIFEHGGVGKAAQSLDVPFLGEIPLHMSIRETSEKGTPLVLTKPGSSESLAYKNLALNVLHRLKS